MWNTVPEKMHICLKLNSQSRKLQLLTLKLEIRLCDDTKQQKMTRSENNNKIQKANKIQKTCTNKNHQEHIDLANSQNK